MTALIAALPMYDWPEARSEVDCQWTRLRGVLREGGIAAPDRLARRNADIPAVPGGIRGASGDILAPDPAVLAPDGLDMRVLWLHPALLLSQTCWGPMELGMAPHVQFVGQPDYSAFEGGTGPLYRSAIVMRRDDISAAGECPVTQAEPGGSIPLERLRGRRLSYNSEDSMSGLLALSRDLDAAGAGLDIFAERIATGGHRASVVAVAEGRADVAAIDCRSWAMARRFEPAAGDLVVVGWTARRKGLPFITSRVTPPDVLAILRGALAGEGMLAEDQGRSA
jgi:ABC-type phosphate/phosphonate transport system substrate-binding protein